MKKVGQTFITVICLFLASILFPTADRVWGADVKIAQIHPMTGALAVIGQSAKRGHELAVGEINGAGGIKSLGGAKLILLNGDTEGKPEVGMSVAERLIREGPAAMMGCYQSNVTFAVTQVAEKNKIPFVIPMAIADNILERGFKYTFRVIYASSMAAEKCLNYIQTLGKTTGKEAQTIAVIFEDTLFGKTTADMIKKANQKMGFKIVAELSYPHRTTDLTSEVAKLKALKPDVVIPISYPTDGILLTRTMADMNFNVLGIVGAANSAFTDPSYIKSLGPLAEYTFNTVPRYNPKNPRAVGVAEKFKKTYGEYFDLTAAYSYVATYVIADALQRARSTKSGDLLGALQNTDMSEHDILTEKGVKFGKVGKMENQNVYANLVLEQILGGELHSVYPPEYSTKQPVWPVPLWQKR
jgi:branched-chain amino acid transport system substrate-binding protein